MVFLQQLYEEGFILYKRGLKYRKVESTDQHVRGEFVSLIQAYMMSAFN